MELSTINYTYKSRIASLKQDNKVRALGPELILV